MLARKVGWLHPAASGASGALIGLAAFVLGGAFQNMHHISESYQQPGNIRNGLRTTEKDT